jgi:hypothetical protein
MSLQMEHQKSVPEDKNVFAVLVLSNPPSSHEAGDWYWKLIAGVPYDKFKTVPQQSGNLSGN